MNKFRDRLLLTNTVGLIVVTIVYGKLLQKKLKSMARVQLSLTSIDEFRKAASTQAATYYRHQREIAENMHEQLLDEMRERFPEPRSVENRKLREDLFELVEKYKPTREEYTEE